MVDEFAITEYASISLLISQLEKTEAFTGTSFSSYVQQHPEYSAKLIEVLEQHALNFSAHTENSIALLTFIKTFMPSFSEKLLLTIGQQLDYFENQGIPVISSEIENINLCLSDLAEVFGRHLIQAQCNNHPQLKIILRDILATQIPSGLQESTDIMFPVLPSNFGEMPTETDQKQVPPSMQV